MSVLAQIGVVLGICLFGEAVSAVLPLPVPAGVTSMIILFVLLCLRVLNAKNRGGQFVPPQQYGGVLCPVLRRHHALCRRLF